MTNITIVGNLTKTPELRKVKLGNDQVSVIDLDIAVNGRRKPNGEEGPATYFRATAWRGLADMLAKYATKGQTVCVTSSDIHARAYMNGKGEPACQMECTVDQFQFCGRPTGASNGNGQAAPAPATAPAAEPAMVDASDEALPF